MPEGLCPSGQDDVLMGVCIFFSAKVAFIFVLIFASSALQLGPLMLKVSHLWMIRSMAAAVFNGFINTLSHSENIRLVVIKTLFRSALSDKS